jgi:hypothetical protein
MRSETCDHIGPFFNDRNINQLISKGPGGPRTRERDELIQPEERPKEKRSRPNDD